MHFGAHLDIVSDAVDAPLNPNDVHCLQPQLVRCKVAELATLSRPESWRMPLNLGRGWE